jgi:exopolyphosphatase/guanosine-5'-triphosphate,3'-diphosphate pyrophosphatase
VDVGSYSVHLLVAEVHTHGLEPLHDESAFLGLGRIVDAEGRLNGARADLVKTLLRYRRQAASLGASSIHVVGTDPLRRATDAPDLVARIRAATGLGIAILSHREEALVALLGVQEGRTLDHETAMVDIGGGSTEVVLAGPSHDPVVVGLPLGATRMTGAIVRHDPPKVYEVIAMVSEALVKMADAPAGEPEELVAVGGTARSLLRVGPRLANRSLTQRRIRRAIDTLTTIPAVAVAEQYGVRLSRVRVLAAGAAILLGATDRYRLDRVRVAKGGLREGVLLAAFHAGPTWLAHVPDLARGWER